MMILAAVIMICIGLERILHVYQHYRSDILANESRHLESIVGTSAAGIDWMLDGYSRQLSMLVGRMDFTQAEEAYLDSRDPNIMRRLMARRELQRLDVRYSLSAWDNGALLAATTPDYPLPSENETFSGDSCLLREDAAGNYWFVFAYTTDQNIRYELAVKVETIFSYQAENAKVGRSGYFFLLDNEKRFVVYSGNGAIGTVSVQQLLQQDPDFSEKDLDSIIDHAPDDYLVFQFPWDESRNETLVVTAPIKMSGNSLTAGAAISFSEFNSFLSDTLREVTRIVLLVIGGALILIVMISGAMISNRRNAMELSVVRERADLMEEINRQQQSLYHAERLQQLGVMTSGIVHEFNNMLTPVMSQSLLLLEELADEGEDTPAFEQALDIYEASEKAREVLKRMSAMGKKDADAGYQIVDLRDILRKTLNLSSMVKNHIRQESFLPDEPIRILGNEQLLNQAFLNLCINACQAMGEEGVLRVSLSGVSIAGVPYAVVQVSDTGPGIPDDVRERIFDPFYSTKGENGTGLGLAICKKIIESHKGTIAAENLTGGGASFIVQIPISGGHDVQEAASGSISGEVLDDENE